MRSKEYVDNDHKIIMEYYDLQEQFDESNIESTIQKLRNLIKKDPDYFDTYLFLYELLQYDDLKEAENILDDAYKRAIKLITDEDGNWPEKLEWGWQENRHIIRTIYHKAIFNWQNRNNEHALELLRELLKTNPNDNIGARNNILAIKMNMTYEEFEDKFNKDGYYDSDLTNWFDKNFKDYPKEFDLWDKEVNSK